MDTKKEGIDIQTEELLTASEAAEFISKAARIKRLTSTTIYRWYTRGSFGVILDSVSIGGKCFTSKEALSRFLNATSEARRLRLQESRKSAMESIARTNARRSESAKKAAVDKAKSELKRPA